MAIVAWLKRELLLNSLIALRRFPLTLIYAFITTLLCIVAMEGNRGDSEIYRYILAAALGVPLSFAVSLYSEKGDFPRTWQMLAQLVLALLLAAYLILFLPAKPTWSAVIRFALVAALSHVWVSFAAYPGGSAAATFWQFNRTLFIRFAVASLFAGALYVGLIIAFLSIDALLGVRINKLRYPELFVLCAGVIHPWFFLAGVPQNLEAEVDTYPPVLRIFAQYILIPLVAIYVVILYLYSAKVIIHWEWPRYKATYLVGLFSAPGILATLLLYPLAISEWVRKYTRIFYGVLLPLVVMMLACVYRRVSEHGLTEMMVVAIAMGIWLIFISLFMLKTQGESIRMVPVTLVAILVVISFGPVSAPTLSLGSQTSRLTNILIEAKVPGGKIILGSQEKIRLRRKDYDEVLHKSQYLADHFGPSALTPFIQGDSDAFIYGKPDSLKKQGRNGYQAHTDFIAHFENAEPEKGSPGSYRYYSIKSQALPIAGFSNMARHAFYRQDSPQSITMGAYKITADWRSNTLIVERGNTKGLFDFGRFYNTLGSGKIPAGENLNANRLTQTFRFGSRRIKVYFARISGEESVRDLDVILLFP